MRIVLFDDRARYAYGVLVEDTIEVLSGLPFEAVERTGERVALADVRLLPPVHPMNIIALGLNYRRHAQESGMKVPDHPQMFLKATTSLAGPGDAIVLPKTAPHEVDYEAELCIVMGKPAKKVTEAEALDYVFGYTCGNDVSARDCQLRLDNQWARGKSFDTFCPLGPWIETELDPDQAPVCSRLNGRVMQQSTTADMIFNCAQIVSFLSEVMTMLPGTVIMTGTPEGVGFARKPPVFLKPGDTIEIEVGGIGVLTNSVAAE